MPAKPLTNEQMEDAGRLKAIFQSWQSRLAAAGKSYSQDEAAAMLLGIGQSGLSQYLNGKIPLNVTAACALASGLGVKVAEFSPALGREIRAAYLVAGNPDDNPDGAATDSDPEASRAAAGTFEQFRAAVRFLLVNDLGTPDLVADELLDADEQFVRRAFEGGQGLTVADVADELRVRPTENRTWIRVKEGQLILDVNEKISALLELVVKTGLYGETKEEVADALLRRGIEAVLPMVSVVNAPARR